MVNSIVEVPSRPIVDGAAKQDQQADGGDFMSMLAGLVSAQSGPGGQTPQARDAADAAPSSTGAEQACPATMVALAGTESGGEGQISVDNTQVGASQPEEQAEPGPVDAAKGKPPEEITKAELARTASGGSGQAMVDEAQASQSQGIEQVKPRPVDTARTRRAEAPAQVATPEMPRQEIPTVGSLEQVEARTSAPPVATEQTDIRPDAAGKNKQASVAEGDRQEVVRALRSVMTERGEARTLPEAAKPAAEIAASLVANRLNPVGQNSRSGAVLLSGEGQSQTREAGSDEPAKNIAAAAIAGSKKPEQAPADAGTRIAVEWKPAEPVTISASSNGGFQDSLQFANGNLRQSEPKELTTGNSNAQAFGVEMKTQLGTDPIVRQAQSAPAPAPQMDPTLGEKMVGQIVREVTLHKLGENTTLSIRLDPPELGTLRISVTSQSGVMTTQIESPSAVVRGILETHLPGLKDALANAGVEVSKFSVSAGLDFGAHAQRQHQAWQPARMAPAVEFDPRMQDQQSVIEAASRGSQTSTASHSWLA